MSNDKTIESLKLVLLPLARQAAADAAASREAAADLNGVVIEVLQTYSVLPPPIFWLEELDSPSGGCKLECRKDEGITVTTYESGRASRRPITAIGRWRLGTVVEGIPPLMGALLKALEDQATENRSVATRLRIVAGIMGATRKPEEAKDGSVQSRTEASKKSTE